jgi:hypothetical protein
MRPFRAELQSLCEQLIYGIFWFSNCAMPATVLLARIQKVLKRHLEVCPTHYSQTGSAGKLHSLSQDNNVFAVSLSCISFNRVLDDKDAA